MSIQTREPAVPTFELRHRLARSLEWAGLTPEDMATELGVHIQTVRNYLKDRHSPNRGTLIAWAFRCGVPPAWLIDGELPESGPDNGPGQVIRPATWTDRSPRRSALLLAS